MNENVIRSLSGLVYIFLLISATLFSKETFLCLFGLFLIQTVREFSSLINFPKTQAMLVSGLLYLLFTMFSKTSFFIDLGLLLGSMFVSIQQIFWLFSDKLQHQDIQSKWVKLIGYITLPFIFIVKIPYSQNQFTPSIIIAIFILIWTNDTFAYIVGKSLGKNKLLERVSPKKTIEGFIGGVVFAGIASIFIAKYYLNASVLVWIITAFIVSVFGTIGDLIESKFKRLANVKDSGSIMPGHGGILDRLDSIIFVAPFLFLFYKIITYVS